MLIFLYSGFIITILVLQFHLGGSNSKVVEKTEMLFMVYWDPLTQFGSTLIMTVRQKHSCVDFLYFGVHISPY